jgi:hypothetical protein
MKTYYVRSMVELEGFNPRFQSLNRHRYGRESVGLKPFFMPTISHNGCAWEGLRGNRLKDLDRRTKQEQKARGKLQAVNGEGVKPDRHGLIEKNGTVPANPGQVRI